MKAILVEQFGGPEVLVIKDVATPQPQENQVLVKVHASALNRADTLQREGHYPPPPGESDILGLEIAGEVVSWGKGVKEFKPGQRVFGLVGSGGYAEYCLIDAGLAMPIPDAMTYHQAAAITEVFFTAQESLFSLGELSGGERVLIHAGGSGVGTAAVQLASAAGATIYITAGSQQKIDTALALGADVGINYKTQDFTEEVLKLTDGQGVDLVLDFIGKAYFNKNIEALKVKGRLVQIAAMSGSKTEIDLFAFLVKRLQLKGMALRSRTPSEKRQVAQDFKTQWLPLFATGQLKPIIDSTYALDDVVAAHQRMDANLNTGKIILTMSE